MQRIWSSSLCVHKVEQSSQSLVISPHQDVFSRFLSGSGAPYWVLLALGLNPRRIHQTGAGVFHSQWAKDGWGGEEGREEAKKDDFTDFPDSKLSAYVR